MATETDPDDLTDEQREYRLNVLRSNLEGSILPDSVAVSILDFKLGAQVFCTVPCRLPDEEVIWTWQRGDYDPLGERADYLREQRYSEESAEWERLIMDEIFQATENRLIAVGDGNAKPPVSTIRGTPPRSVVLE